MSVCIEIKNLTKCYGPVVAVSGLSLEVGRGEALCLLGANGAGKTTTLYAICGLVRLTAGKVLVFGKDLEKDFLNVAPRMGVLVERPSFFDYLTARENLSIAAELAQKEVPIEKALDRVGLLSVADKKVKTFSLGMRQRLGLAQAILTEPELLILDEPLSGLDPEGGREILQLLRSLVDSAQVTIVFSSHMLSEVEVLADRVAILNRGRLLAVERIDSVLSYDESEVEVFLDAPQAAAKRLESLGWAHCTEISPRKLRVRLQNETVHHLITFLVGQGFVLNGVVPRRRTLEEYLLRTMTL